MAVKDTWVDGDTVHGSDLNTAADAINIAAVFAAGAVSGQSAVLTAGDFVAGSTLEIASDSSVEIPSTSSLEIWNPAADPSVATLGTAQTITNKVLMGEVFDSASVKQSCVLPAGDYLANVIMEIDPYSSVEIPSTSTLEIYCYTPPALAASGAAAASVATLGSTASTTYVNITGTTDQVTVTVGALGMVLLGLTASASAGVGDDAVVNFAATGANTITPDPTIDDYALFVGSDTATTGVGASAVNLLTGLYPGATTFKMKYRSAVGAGADFSNRHIWALPL